MTLRRRSILTFFIAFVLCLSMSVEKSTAQQAHKIILAGYNHSPSVPTSGSGMATVSFENDTLKVKGDFKNLVGAFRGAYIMVGEKGKPGNMLFRLEVEVNEERTGGVIKPKNNAFTLNDAQKPLLKDGELFINITSYEHPSGELRGQIPGMNID
ncbi:CHRD domain-containing protein [Aliifodinibius salicampi]|uniref:CHRD domain-containing protein n=1 Tax=Fodinibius salicampi TaxID=1920655 RepID=A0ABT3PYP9_9BACT|nr:CHRD domain-containing protein [Fodinibius salicampi]MCW9712980.1 CHRD domain-containing protein [Fodinibius salicampi]